MISLTLKIYESILNNIKYNFIFLGIKKSLKMQEEDDI